MTGANAPTASVPTRPLPQKEAIERALLRIRACPNPKVLPFHPPFSFAIPPNETAKSSRLSKKGHRHNNCYTPLQ